MDPSLSVLIATYHRPQILRNTLDAFTSLVPPAGGWELIVIDNNSQDETRSVCEGFATRLPLSYMFEPKQGKSHALNRGLDVARADLLLFTDDDITPDAQWLMEMAKAAQKWAGFSVFAGRITGSWPTGTPEIVRRVLVPWLDFTSRPIAPPEGPLPKGWSPPGANLMIRRSVVDAGFRYNVRLGPHGNRRVAGCDKDFVLRLCEHGHSVVYVPSAQVVHRIKPEELTAAALRRRSIGFGRGASYHKRHTPVESKRVGGIPLWVFRKLLSLLVQWAIKTVRGDKEGAFIAKHRVFFNLGILSYWRTARAMASRES